MPGGSDKPNTHRALVVKRSIQIVVAVGLVAAIYILVLPRFAGFSDVWAVIGAMTWLELVTLALLGVWNLATYWLVEVASFPGLNYWQAMKVVLTSTAIANTLPGGGAFGLATTSAMYNSYGFPPQKITLSIVSQGVWNNFVKLGMPIVAIVLLALTGGSGGALIIAAVVGLALLVVAVVAFALVLRSEATAVVVSKKLAPLVSFGRRILKKPPSESDLTASVVEFRRETIDFIRERWFQLTWTVLVSHITLYLVLLLTLRHVGIPESQVSWIEVLAAFSFVRLISALPITPGGVGIVELGMTAALVAAGGPEAEVIAAVLVFRLLTYLLPIPLGGLAYLFWKKGAARRRLAVQEREKAGLDLASTRTLTRSGPAPTSTRGVDPQAR